MAVHLESVQNSKDSITLDDEVKSYAEPEVLYACDIKNVKCVSTINKKDQLSSNKIEDKISLDASEEEMQYNKTLNVREIHETSPFKQAVKGFVLNKLSKKVGSSHILSGITEKIVKKLEDNKDNIQPMLVHSSESDLNISSLSVKEPSSDIISSSLSCELKSVVANDLALIDVLNIEDAVECFEEPKSSTSDINVGINIPLRTEYCTSSISLPSSPAHRFTQRASSISCSLEHVELTEKNIHSINSSTLDEEKDDDYDSITNKKESKNKTEPQESKKEVTRSNNDTNSGLVTSYLGNIYSNETEEISAFNNNLSKSFYFFCCAVKNIFCSLSLSHFFLLAAVIFHNLDFSSYILFIFDGLIIAYVCYSYICNLLQRPIPSKTLSFLFTDPYIENASVNIQKISKDMKGSVKVLKEEYDPEMVMNHSTDLVDISIEYSCLKIFASKKKSAKDGSVKPETFTSYDLNGANIILVPKDLSRKRIWNKKYPICIAFPACKKLSTLDKNNDIDSERDQVDLYTSQFEESRHQKALYIFTLTDREKESLYWVLQRNTKDDDKDNKNNDQTSDTTSKINFSSVSYTALLESTSNDSFLLSKETSEDDSLSTVDTNVALDFEDYMKTLFENYERMTKFTSSSRSYEDMLNTKEDQTKLTDSFIFTDDTYLSNTSDEYSVDWLNLVLGRVFYDFLTQKYWSDDIKTRIQKKLDKIEMPSFIDSLEISDVFLGTSLPQMHTVSRPIADGNGIWFNFDFNYYGSFQMTLKTKLNITKAKQSEAEAEDASESKSNIIAVTSESSDEEIVEVKSTTSIKKKKLLNRIEKWISHKHFQTVAQSKFVKRYVGDLSNMPLTLTVELKTLHGTLTINVPPAPTDRIWYGFLKDPALSLTAFPKVGTHEINLSAIVQMIEKKLIQEFKKALVMPNMDDLLIPVMHTPIYDQ